MSPLSRLLMFLSIALVVAVAGLWISGGKKEEYSAKITIGRRPSQIFPYLVEPAKLKGWMTGLEQIDQPMPPDSNYTTPPDLLRTVVSPNGKRVQFKDLVIRYTPDEILTIQSSASGTVQTTILQLEPVDARSTRFSYHVKVSNNSLARLMAPLQVSKLQERVSADVQKLKALVEKEQPQLPDLGPPAETKKAIEKPAEPSPAIDLAAPDVSENTEEDEGSEDD